jgi:uncharacterized protein YndB with AHSA1/START domain
MAACSPRQAWTALTTGDGLAGWWCDSARIDPREGGRVVLAFVEDDPEAPAEARATLHTFRPTSHIELAFDRGGSGPLRGHRYAFQLARDGQETRITATLTLPEPAEGEDAEATRATADKDLLRSLRALQEMLDGDASA